MAPPVLLPGESLGQRSLEGYSPWGCKESDMTELLTLSLSHTHTHIHTHIYTGILWRYCRFSSRPQQSSKYSNQVSHMNFWFPSAYESYTDTILNSIKFILTIVLCLKKDVHILINNHFIAGDFPGGPAVKNRPCSAGHAGWSPVRRGRSHVPWSTSNPSAAATEPMRSRAPKPQPQSP